VSATILDCFGHDGSPFLIFYNGFDKNRTSMPGSEVAEARILESASCPVALRKQP